MNAYARHCLLRAMEEEAARERALETAYAADGGLPAFEALDEAARLRREAWRLTLARDGGPAIETEPPEPHDPLAFGRGLAVGLAGASALWGAVAALALAAWP